MRRVPTPLSVSRRAQEMLENIQSMMQNMQATAVALPEANDIEGWRRHIAQRNEDITRSRMVSLSDEVVRSNPERIAGVAVVRAQPAKRTVAAGKLLLDIHGGALIYLGGAYIEPWARSTAVRTGVELVAVDYRMPPEHPFPAGLDDCVAVYAHLVREVGAGNLIVSGASAGGNLAAALMLRAREAGLPMPAALALLSPEVDLTESGDTFRTLLGIDAMGSLMSINRLYAGAHPLEHPHLSPLFGDLSQFPPTFLQSGTRDLFLSNTVRMHRALRKAGVAAELHIWEAMPHGGFMGAAEDEEVDVELRNFIARHCR